MWQIKVSAGNVDRLSLILKRINGKPGFHVIADDRGSQNVVQSYGNTVLRSSALSCVREIISVETKDLRSKCNP